MINLNHKALSLHKQQLFKNLIFRHNGATKKRTLTRREFYTDESLEENGGDKKAKYAYICDYYEMQEEDIGKKFALEKEMIERLPIIINSSITMYDKKTDEVVNYPMKYASFKIVPKKMMELRDVITPHLFEHTSPDEYEQHVVTSFAALIFRLAMWQSANPSFGKSSVYETMDFWHNNVVVVENAKTVPTFYKKIPEDGVLVLDEMAKSNTEASMKMWYALNMMGNMSKSILTMDTAGSAAYGTNVPKPITNCSAVCLMNRVEDYANKEDFAEYMFHNNKSIDRRYLKLRLGYGQLITKSFHIWEPFTEKEKLWLIQAAKTINYYKLHEDNGEVVCGIDTECDKEQVSKGLELMEGKYNQTHYDSVYAILKTYSVYCGKDTEKFTSMVKRLLKWIKSYSDALQEETYAELVDKEMERKEKKKERVTEQVLSAYDEDIL